MRKLLGILADGLFDISAFPGAMDAAFELYHLYLKRPLRVLGSIRAKIDELPEMEAWNSPPLLLLSRVVERILEWAEGEDVEATGVISSISDDYITYVIAYALCLIAAYSLDVDITKDLLQMS